MRVHIYLDDDLVEALDEHVGHRERSSYIADAVKKQLDSDRRWRKIRSAIGSISDTGHDWDEDPAAWVHEQRRKGERPLP